MTTPPAPATPPKPRRPLWRRLLSWQSALRLLLLVLTLLLGIGIWLAGTEGGARVTIGWVSGLLPNFQARYQSGTLLGPLQLESVTIKGNTRIELRRVLIDWVPGELLLGNLHLTRVQIDQVRVLQPPAAAPAAKKKTAVLTTLRLPLDLRIDQLDVAELVHRRGDKQSLYTRLATALVWEGTQLQLDNLVLGTPRWETALSGTLETRDDWRLDARLRFVFPRTPTAQDEPPYLITGSLRGPLARVHTDLQLAGPVQATLTGELAPLTTGIPFSAQLHATELRVPPRAPLTRAAILSGVALTGGGDLLGALTVRGSAQLDTPWTEPVPVTLAAQGSWQGFRQAEITFRDPRLDATLVTDYWWLNGQKFRGTLTVRNLDLVLTNPALHSALAGSIRIEGVIPAATPAAPAGGPQVALGIDQLTGTLNERPGVVINGPVRWQDGQWLFDDLQLRQQQNLIVLRGSLGESWNADATLALGDLHTLVPAFAGTGTGRAHLSGPPTDPQFAFLLDARALQLPAVPLPAVLQQGDGERSVRLPAADWQLRGDTTLRTAHLTDAHTVAGPFTMQATGDVRWADTLAWDFATRITGLPLAQLLPELGGHLGGPFHTRGSFAKNADGSDSLATLTVTTDLTGRLDEEPLRFAADADWTPTTLDLRQLSLQHADNQLDASAALSATQVMLQLKADAPDLATSLREVAGSVQANIRVEGPRKTPDAELDINAAGLRWQDYALGDLAVHLQLEDGAFAASGFTLAAQQLARGNTRIDAITASASGSRDQHEIEAKLVNGPLAILLGVSGQLVGGAFAGTGAGSATASPTGDATESGNAAVTPETPAPHADDIWRGVLSHGEISLRDWHWSVVSAAPLVWSANADTGHRGSLGAHCWSDRSARLCLTEPFTLADNGDRGNLALEAFHLPLEALLAEFLPLDTTIQGRLGAMLKASWNHGELVTADLQLQNAEALQISLIDDDDRLRNIATIETVLASVRLGDGHWLADGTVAGANVGNIHAHLATTRPRADAPPGPQVLGLQGGLQVSNLNIGLAEAFTYQMHHIGGLIDADIALGGTTAAPQVTGSGRVRDGHFTFTRTPVTIIELNLDGQFDGNALVVDGSFRTPDSPTLAALNGNFRRHADGWRGRGSLVGKNLQLALPPEYQFTLSPDLALVVQPREIAITGDVQVPQGRIDIRRLPVQSVSRSGDVVRIQSQQVVDEGGVGFRQRVDINLVLGDDVKFKAFGGDGRLTGDLRVRSTPQLPFQIDGELHVHEGSYNALGQQLKLKQADIIFNGPADQPLIDALAVREFNDAAVREVGVRLTGSLRTPQTTLWSSPELPQEEALSWLTTGRALSSGPLNLRGEAAQAALSLGTAQGSALLTQAGQEIGLQDVQLSTDGDGEESAVEVGTNVNERIYVGYSRRVFTGEASVLVRLQMTRRLVLEALSGVESALDIFYTFEF